MIEEYKNIELKIEELSTLLGFFRQKSIKKVLYKYIEKIELDYFEIQNELQNLQEEYKNYQDESNLTIKVKIEENKLLENEKSRLSQEYNNLEKKYSEDISKIEDSLEKVKKELQTLKEEYKNYQDENNLAIKMKTEENELLENEKLKLNQEYNTLDKEYKNLLLKSQLISKLLSTNSNSKNLFQYREIIEKDFLEFAKKEESSVDEVTAIYKLQSIEKELELVSIYPSLYKKNIVAVGGGFSAGKSKFINSLIEDSRIKLPENMNPTTAIPTYVMHDEKKQFIGCNQNGGVIDLYELDETFHSKLNHDFIKSFEFNLNKIMPFMIIGTAITKFPNLCFLDTPGYNSANTGYTEEDKNNAKNSLDNCENILWIIAALQGTINKTDINFLTELRDLENKDLYFIINPKGVEIIKMDEIIQEIEEMLDLNEINYIGISVYNPEKKEEIQYRKKSLFEFLESIDNESDVQDKLIKKLYDVNYMYQEAILKNIREKEKVISLSSFLRNEFFSKGFHDFSEPIYQELDKLIKIHSSKAQEEDLQILEKVTLKLKNVIDEIFGRTSNIKLERILKENIELNNDIYIDYNKKKSLFSGLLNNLNELVSIKNSNPI